MRKLCLLTILLTVSYIVNAQDIIVLCNADEIEAKVTTVAEDEVSYKRWSNLEGPTYILDKSQIFYIKYENGEKELINEIPIKESTSSKGAATKDFSSLTPISFRGYAKLGTLFMPDMAGPTLDITAGVQIFEHLYAGIETGFHTYIESFYNTWYEENQVVFCGYIPLGVNLKGYFTNGRKVNPYLECSLGGYFGVGEALGGLNGFHGRVGAGLEVKRFVFGIGYNVLTLYGMRADMGYINLGWRFGK